MDGSKVTDRGHGNFLAYLPSYALAPHGGSMCQVVVLRRLR